jgi:hypothetical protein
MATTTDPTLLKFADVAVKIEMTAHGRRSRVFVGDKELSGVFGMKVEASVHGVTMVHLDMYALGGVTVEGIAGVLAAGVTTEEQLRAATPIGSSADVTSCGDNNRVYRTGVGAKETA